MTVIRNGRIIDPANRRDEIGDLCIVDGRHRRPVQVPNSRIRNPRRSTPTGLVVAPGLIDIHVHLREPGQSAQGNHRHRHARGGGGRVHERRVHAEHLAVGGQPERRSRGSQKAREREGVRERLPHRRDHQRHRGRGTRARSARCTRPASSPSPTTAIACRTTKSCAARSNTRACSTCPSWTIARTTSSSAKASCTKATGARVLGLPGWPRAGEEMIVAAQHPARRTLRLADPLPAPQLAAAACGFCARRAARGVKISGEVCPHHIALTDESIRGFDTNFKMNPPLRAAARRRRCSSKASPTARSPSLPAITRRTAAYEKEVEFDQAPFGILGLETELGLFLDILVHKKKAIDLAAAHRDVHDRIPRGCSGSTAARSRAGAPADVTLIDPDLEWTVDKNASLPLPQHAVPRLAAQRPRRANHRRRRDGLGALRRRLVRRKNAVAHRAGVVGEPDAQDREREDAVGFVFV